MAVTLTFSLLVGASTLPAAASGAPGAPDTTADEAATTRAGATVDDRVVVLWEPDTPPSRRAELLADVGERGTPRGRVDTVSVGADRVAAVAAQLTAAAEVVVAEPDQLVEGVQAVGIEPEEPTAAPNTVPDDAAPTPDDPLFEQQWGLENRGQLVTADGVTSTPGVDVAARQAWATTMGSPEVTVAVIDAGTDLTHPDLAGAIWHNEAEVRDGTDSDGNGYVDDLNGWDFIRDAPIDLDDPTSYVVEAHGTYVAGVIAARADDGFGMAGMAPRTTILPIRAFEEVDERPGAGTSDLATLVAAVDYAAAAGADVINASWESGQPSIALAAALAAVEVPVVAASGNRALDLDSGVVAEPASLELANLLSVTAIGPMGELPAFANRGRRTVDLGAPGTSIVTTAPGGSHRELTQPVNGTSFAAPHVSGALALGMASAPDTPTAELLETLRRTTVPEASLVDTTITGGRLDAAAFLRELERPVCGAQLLPLAGFEDVAPNGTHARSIDCIAAVGVTSGYVDGTFRPGVVVRRGQLASFLAAIIDTAGQLPQDPPDAFVDDDGSVHEDAMNALAALDVLRGDEQRRVRHNDPVTRGQLAALLVRTHQVLDGELRTASRSWFQDTPGTTHEEAIDVARDLGLLRGRDRVHFAASEGTRRDQLASTLARMLDSLAREGVPVEVPAAR